MIKTYLFVLYQLLVSVSQKTPWSLKRSPSRTRSAWRGRLMPSPPAPRQSVWCWFYALLFFFFVVWLLLFSGNPFLPRWMVTVPDAAASTAAVGRYACVRVRASEDGVVISIAHCPALCILLMEPKCAGLSRNNHDAGESFVFVSSTDAGICGMEESLFLSKKGPRPSGSLLLTNTAPMLSSGKEGPNVSEKTVPIITNPKGICKNTCLCLYVRVCASACKFTCCSRIL